MKNLKNAPHSKRKDRGWAGIMASRCASKLRRLWPSLYSGGGRLCHFALRFDPESLELQTGALALSAGLWMGMASMKQGQREALLGRLHAYLWPVPLWAAAFVLVGFVQIIALGRARLGVRCACAMCGFCLWAFLFALAVIGAVPGMGVALFPFIALSEGWIYLRLSVPSRASISQPSFAPTAELPTSTSPPGTPT